MKTLFYPNSIVIFGLSSKPNNIPRLILENLIRWGFRGRILGINSRSNDVHVDGIKIYKSVDELPVVPDLAVLLVPARFVPELMEECGRIGIRWASVPSGGFNEFNETGQKLAEQMKYIAKKYGMHFVGPNSVTIANTANGLCLPFVPCYSPPQGGLSIISQSGGIGLWLWNMVTDENVGMAKFASIGNKLDLDEVDFLEFMGQDPETEIIGLYLESISRGEKFIEVATKIDKPIIVLKSGKTDKGKTVAMSHTAAISNDDEIIDAAFEKAGVIRIYNFSEFVSIAKAFKMPPMTGNRLMVMSPAGGIAVMMADLCEKYGFDFADPGKKFYDSLKNYSNAGVINFSNPLDMGDIYDPAMYTHIFNSVLHNENVDGAVYISQWPHMPKGDDVFTKMFKTDLSKEITGTMRSANKPMAPCLFGLSETISKIKQNLSIPIFDTPDEMISSLRKQCDFYTGQMTRPQDNEIPNDINIKKAQQWLETNDGTIGEEAVEFLSSFNISFAESEIASDEGTATLLAEKIGYPVVMKIVSPDAIHKSEAGGVVLGIQNKAEAINAFHLIKSNLLNYKKDADFSGVRVTKEAGSGYDMFIGGKQDDSFGPVIYFGFGGIYVELFNDVEKLLCPVGKYEVEKKLKKLKSYKMLKGLRGKQSGDIDSYVGIIIRVSHMMYMFRQIKEIDLNPIRLLEDGSGTVVLDIRMEINNLK